MPVPIIAASFIGGIAAAITQFFMSRAGSIIAGLGLTFIGVKSMETFIGYVIGDMQQIVSIVQSAGGGSGGIGGAGLANLAAMAMQFAAYAGLFDALNIVISGYMAYASLTAVRFIVGRFK